MIYIKMGIKLSSNKEYTEKTFEDELKNIFEHASLRIEKIEYNSIKFILIVSKSIYKDKDVILHKLEPIGRINCIYSYSEIETNNDPEF